MMIRFAEGKTTLHGLNPLSKVSFIAAWSVAALLVDNLVLQFTGLALLILMDGILGPKSLRPFLFSRFVLILGGTILLMQILFTSDGRVLWTAPFSWPHIAVTDLGIRVGILLTLRFLNIVLMGEVFVATTDPVQLVHSLMKAGVPYRYGFMILMMLRFIPLFEEERNTIGNAQKMRGLEIDKLGPRKLLLSLRYILLPLVVSALTKADALELSMEARAFGYAATRTFLRAQICTRIDRALIAASLTALVAVIANVVLR